MSNLTSIKLVDQFLSGEFKSPTKRQIEFLKELIQQEQETPEGRKLKVAHLRKCVTHMRREITSLKNDQAKKEAELDELLLEIERLKK